MGNDADPDRIADGTHHHGNRASGLFGRYRSRRALGQDQIDGQRGQLHSHGGEAVIMTFREATHQVQVLALDVAILCQLAYKPLDRRQRLWRQDSDEMSPLLRAHCEWPGGHGAADQRDESPSLHVLPPPEGNTLPHRDAAALCSTAKAIAEWSKWVNFARPRKGFATGKVTLYPDMGQCSALTDKECQKQQLPRSVRIHPRREKPVRPRCSPADIRLA